MVITLNLNLYKYELIGFIFTNPFATLSQFFYHWFPYNTAIGAITPINNSPWEQLKTIWFPYIIWSVISYFLMKRPKFYWFPKALGGMCGIGIMTLLFYTYSGILGKTTIPLNLFAAFAGVFSAFITSYLILKSGKANILRENIGVAIIIAISILFIWFTFMPPLIPWFRDLHNLTYGI